MSASNTLKMEWLREACAGLGLNDVRTYVQSGNIVFNSRLGAPKLAQMLKAMVDAQTRLPVTVVVRSAAELANASSPAIRLQNRKASISPSCTSPSSTRSRQSPRSTGSTRSPAVATNTGFMAGSEIHLHCPLNYGETKLSNVAIEKALGVGATTRNLEDGYDIAGDGGGVICASRTMKPQNARTTRERTGSEGEHHWKQFRNSKTRCHTRA